MLESENGDDADFDRFKKSPYARHNNMVFLRSEFFGPIWLKHSKLRKRGGLKSWTTFDVLKRIRKMHAKIDAK